MILRWLGLGGGHIALLPRILESLAVSGSPAEITASDASSPPSVPSPEVRQLLLQPPPCYAETRPEWPLASATPQLLLLDSPESRNAFTPAGPSSFPSPASRKRSNSITNAGDNSANAPVAALAPSIRPVPKKIQSINQSINKWINKSVNQSINKPINKLVNQSINR